MTRKLSSHAASGSAVRGEATGEDGEDGSVGMKLPQERHRVHAAMELHSEVGPLRLAQLAAAIRQHHQVVLASLRRTLDSAIACGEALSEAKRMVPSGLWMTWTTENVGMDMSSVRLYIRIAHFRQELHLVGIDSISAAQTYLRENALVLKVSQHPEEKTVEVQALAERGLSSHRISQQTGIPRATVSRWLKTGSSKRVRVTSGARPPKPAAPPIAITDDMIEGMARWLALRGGGKLTDTQRHQATEALRVALNYKRDGTS